jgi:dethiobiotin synthase
MAIFVTGTSTGVGKTITCAYIIKKYKNIIKNLKYWKPIQTGYPPDDDSKTVQILSEVDESYILPSLKFKEPVSPHFAAELENKEISVEQILNDYQNYKKHYKLVIEGAGGIMVPITRKYLFVDFVKDLNIPVLVVVKSILGCINHSLLTIEALKKRNISIVGLVFCGEHREPYLEDSRKIINELSNVPIISYFDINSDKQIDVDPNNILLKYF